MRRFSLCRLKVVVAGLAVAGLIAMGGNAQAVPVPYNPNLAFGPGYGDADNPVVYTGNVGSGPFLHAVDFDLGPFTHFNMTSTTNNLTLWFGAAIFTNVGDNEVANYMLSFTNFPLADLGISMPPGDYHLHPSGVGGSGGGSYTLTMWGTFGPPPPPVPVPAAVYLFGTGLVGLAGLARRRRAI